MQALYIKEEIQSVLGVIPACFTVPALFKELVQRKGQIRWLALSMTD